jgi:CheY-like chemotaxis protein
MPKHILVVDDDPDIRQILQDRLESYGYLVDTAADGMSAIQKIEQLAPSGVFLDIRMPGMNGLEVLGRIKSRYHTLSVVIVTATDTAGLPNSPIHTAAQACLLKPFDTPQIRQVVEQCFGQADG